MSRTKDHLEQRINARAKTGLHGKESRSYEKLGGIEHKNIRRALSASAVGKRSVSREVILWPGEIVEGVIPRVDCLMRASNTIASLGFTPQTAGLMTLPITMILAGFRPFASLAQAQIAQARFAGAGKGDGHPELSGKFNDALTLISGALQCSREELRRHAHAQSRPGTAPFSQETMSKWVTKAFAVNPPLENAENQVTRANDFLQGLAQALYKRFECGDSYASWKALRKGRDHAFELILAKIESESSVVIGRAEHADLGSFPAHSTWAYDRSAICLIPQNDGYDLHRAYMVLAQSGARGKDFDRLIDPGHGNHLSWLLNPKGGLAVLGSASLDKLATIFGIPKQGNRLEAVGVINAVAKKLIASDNAIGEPWQNYRTQLAGKFVSWSTNHRNRLADLLQTCEFCARLSWSDEFDLPNNQARFNLELYSRDSFKEELERLAQCSEVAQMVLVGLQGGIAGFTFDGAAISVLEDFAEVYRHVAGGFRTLLQTKIPLDDYAKLHGCSSGRELLNQMEKSSRLIRFGGGVPDFANELNTEQDMFNSASEFLAEITRMICDVAASGRTQSLDHAFAEKARVDYQRHISGPKEIADIDFAERGSRLCLFRLVSACGRLSTITQNLIIHELRDHGVINRKQSHKIIRLGLGRLYKHPKSTYRGVEIPVWDRRESKPEGLYLSRMPSAGEVFSVIESTLERLARNLDEPRLSDRQQLFKDYIHLLAERMFMCTSRLQDGEFSFTTSRDRIEAFSEHAKRGLLEQLDAPVMQTRVLNDLINLAVVGCMRGKSFHLLRSDTRIKLPFESSGFGSLTYTPKARLWDIPPSLKVLSHPAAKVLADLHDDVVPSVVEVVELVESMRKMGTLWWQSNQAGIHQLLRQSPHDWVFLVNKKEFGEPKAFDGLTFTKDRGFLSSCKPGVVPSNKPKASLAIRLCGTSQRKGLLDRQLVGDVEVSGITLNFDVALKHEASVAIINGLPQVTNVSTSIDQCSVVVVTPLAIKELESTGFPWADRFIAIDQGEAGIGYAVFDARSGELIHDAEGNLESGAIAIGSIRRLIDRVRKHRHADMKKGLFKSQSRDLQEMRKAVVGDVCHIIESLCHHYKAFPILESNLKNLNQGAKEIDRIYKAVSNTYMPGEFGVEAHLIARKNHWKGGVFWVHPYLQEHDHTTEMETEPDGEDADIRKRKYAKPKNLGKSVPLKLYPGSGVQSHGTSQTCSCCRKNPIELVKLARLDDIAIKTVSLAGKRYFNAEVNGHALKLGEVFDVKMKAVLETAASKGGSIEETREAVIRELKRKLRRSSGSGSDTKQSWYTCAFTDCKMGKIVNGQRGMHADENAAINIGRKWYDSRGIQVSKSDVP